jgi:dTDP-4-amino-4,6-dideoxygalactose transaminase
MKFEIPYHRPLDIEFKVPKDIRESGMLSNFKYVNYLEYKIRELYGVEYAIACSSNSIGLLITLQAYDKTREKDDIEPNYGIASPAFAWFSTKWAIESNGFYFRAWDINRETWLIEDKHGNFSIILPVHTFGNVMEAKSKEVIYDGAHALGSVIKDFGIATVFSLAPTKLITSCEGGIIVTNDHELAGKIIQLRNKVSRMSEINAIWGITTLSRLDEMLEWKRECRKYYEKNLPGDFQKIPIDSNHATIGFLTDMIMPPEIEFRKYYMPLEFGLPNANYVYSKIVCLPSWFGVDYELVTEKILQFNAKV